MDHPRFDTTFSNVWWMILECFDHPIFGSSLSGFWDREDLLKSIGFGNVRYVEPSFANSSLGAPLWDHPHIGSWGERQHIWPNFESERISSPRFFIFSFFLVLKKHRL